ncbi:MAG: PadR family transcriptional regulator [Anaerolineales bacterium]
MKSPHRHTSGLSPEYALLGFLDQSPAHGYELYQKLQENLGEIWHVSLSQTYNILNRLETQGLIWGVVQGQEKRPAKRCYYLSDTGRYRLETWLASLSTCSVRAIRVEFITRLYFLYARNPQLAVAAIQAQVNALQADISRLKARLPVADPQQMFNHMGMALRIRQLEVLAETLSEYQARLVTPSES